MNIKKVVFAILKVLITLSLIVVIMMLVYKGAIKAYDFGFRIFAEEPMSPAPGLTMSVAIVEGKSVMEIGEILEEKGLVRSAYLFYLQEFFSSYHKKLQPGIYELSTAMTPEEMMSIMATVAEDEEQIDDEPNGNSAAGDVISENTVSDNEGETTQNDTEGEETE